MRCLSSTIILPAMFIVLLSAILTANALKCWDGTDLIFTSFNISTTFEAKECPAQNANCFTKECKYGNGTSLYSLGCADADECNSGTFVNLCKATGELSCTNCTGDLCNGALRLHFFGTFAMILTVFTAFSVFRH
ncbi:hypothetical protein GPALN_005577 [Globodera pallida]|uniref:Transmembrane protein n=1 Tax=Globodera pallida TaxID=36090 RepID=A0A183BHS5_GLOPA|nr:hypothetical protein GPALN_005577 [Globodera pallida]